MATSRNIETTKQQTLSQDFEQIVKALVYGDASVSLEYIENFAATVTGASLVVIYQAIQSSNVIAMIENAPVEFSEQASRAFKILDTIIAQAADEEPIEMSRARIKNMLHAVTDKAPFAAKVLAATAVMGAITTLPAHAQPVDSGTDTSSNSNHRATTVLITQNGNTPLISDGNPSDSNQPQTSIYIAGSGNPSDGTYQETQKPEVVARPAYASDQAPVQYDVADESILTEQGQSSSDDHSERGSVTIVDISVEGQSNSPEAVNPPSIAELLSGESLSVPKTTAVDELRVMSYNILGASHTNNGGISPSKRLKHVVSVIDDTAPSVIGFQEVQHRGKFNQFAGLKKALGDTYTSFPANPSSDAAKRVIYFKTTQYDLLDSGTYEAERYGTKHAKFPWVKLLEKATGKEIYVFNIHTTAGNGSQNKGESHRPPDMRKIQTKALLKKITQVVKEDDSKVIVIGDFNSTCEKTGNDRGVSLAEIPCTMMTKAGFTDSGEQASDDGTSTNSQYSTSHGKAGSLKKTGRHIDHVFVRGFSINDWKNVVNGDTPSGSDHTPVVTTIQASSDPDQY